MPLALEKQYPEPLRVDYTGWYVTHALRRLLINFNIEQGTKCTDAEVNIVAYLIYKGMTTCRSKEWFFQDLKHEWECEDYDPRYGWVYTSANQLSEPNRAGVVFCCESKAGELLGKLIEMRILERVEHEKNKRYFLYRVNYIYLAEAMRDAGESFLLPRVYDEENVNLTDLISVWQEEQEELVQAAMEEEICAALEEVDSCQDDEDPLSLQEETDGQETIPVDTGTSEDSHNETAPETDEEDETVPPVDKPCIEDIAVESGPVEEDKDIREEEILLLKEPHTTSIDQEDDAEEGLEGLMEWAPVQPFQEDVDNPCPYGLDEGLSLPVKGGSPRHGNIIDLIHNNNITQQPSLEKNQNVQSSHPVIQLADRFHDVFRYVPSRKNGIKAAIRDLLRKGHTQNDFDSAFAYSRWVVKRPGHMDNPVGWFKACVQRKFWETDPGYQEYEKARNRNTDRQSSWKPEGQEPLSPEEFRKGIGRIFSEVGIERKE